MYVCVTLRYGYDLADPVGNIVFEKLKFIVILTHYWRGGTARYRITKIIVIRPPVPQFIADYSPRHGLSPLDDRLRQAVSVVKHYLFHLLTPVMPEGGYFNRSP
jgi:hypothetical protein